MHALHLILVYIGVATIFEVLCLFDFKTFGYIVTDREFMTVCNALFIVSNARKINDYMRIISECMQRDDMEKPNQFDGMIYRCFCHGEWLALHMFIVI